MDKTSASSNKIDDDYKVDQRFILNIFGLYLFFDALIGLSSGFVSLLYLSAQEYEAYNVARIKIERITYLISDFIKLVFALTLILQSKGWVKILRKIRGLGVSNN